MYNNNKHWGDSMSLFNLKDFTILVPTRLVDNDRVENLTIFLKYMDKYFDTNIIIGEQDKEQKVYPMLNGIKNITHYVFHHFDKPYFWKTRIINLMALNVKTPYLMVIDNDIIIDVKTFQEVAEKLRSDEIDYTTKLGTRIYRVFNEEKQKFKQHFDPYLIRTNYTKPTAPGIYAVKTPKFFECGMENEYFQGWGREDVERNLRFVSLGLKTIYNIGKMWHLEHQFQKNRITYQNKNHEIFMRTKNAVKNVNDLKKYILSFPWLKEYNINV